MKITWLLFSNAARSSSGGRALQPTCTNRLATAFQSTACVVNIECIPASMALQALRLVGAGIVQFLCGGAQALDFGGVDALAQLAVFVNIDQALDRLDVVQLRGTLIPHHRVVVALVDSASLLKHQRQAVHAGAVFLR